MAPMVETLSVSSVDRFEVLRYLGHRGQEVTPDIEARIDDAIVRCLALSRPRACVRSFDVGGRTVSEDGIPELSLAGCALRLSGTSISQHMEGAVAIGVMAVTLGAAVDQELRRLSLTDPVSQVMLDAVATATVESAADAAEALLVSDAASRGLFSNSRFSPGYGDLPLDCQQALLATLDATRLLGITLTPSLLMVPTKSVTAVVGYFTEPQASSHLGCESCNLRDYCNVRAAGTTCHGS